MRDRWIIASAVFAVALSSCASAQREEPPGSLGEWIADNARTLELESDNFEDLQFLKPLLKGKRVVQLGENAHGIREYNLLKTRIVRFLHAQLGYDVLAFESSVYQCYDSNLTADAAPASTTLYLCAFGVWHTEGVLDLFEYLAETRGGEQPLELAGFDVQPIGRNKDDRPEFLSGIVGLADTEYAAEVEALDTLFLEVYSRASRDRRTYFRSEQGQQMAAGYDRLAAFLDENRIAIGETPGMHGTVEIEVALRVAASMAWYIRQQSSSDTRGYVERRDRGMAENLISILDVQYPDRKVIVWGHNFHLRHDNFAIPPDEESFPGVAARTMGSWVRERYGDQLYTVGLYAYQGQAIDNSGETFEIKSAGPGSVEALLHAAGEGAVFLDVSRWDDAGRVSWMDEPLTARFNGTQALPMRLDDQYDALLVVDEATPGVKLY